VITDSLVFILDYFHEERSIIFISKPKRGKYIDKKWGIQVFMKRDP